MLNERLADISLHNVTITRQMVEDGIAALPPTPPKAYKKLEECCDFRVLYLIQGESRDTLPYRGMKDMIFLNYKSNENKNDLYFPKSDFLYGRTAMYLAARLLEMSQGWLYDYFIFGDDDAEILHGTLELFY